MASRLHHSAGEVVRRALAYELPDKPVATRQEVSATARGVAMILLLALTWASLSSHGWARLGLAGLGLLAATAVVRVTDHLLGRSR